MNTTPTTLEIVEFGLDAIPSDRTVTVPLRDLLFVHQVLGELNRFFHQPLHYGSLGDVQTFLQGRGDGGGYDAIHQAYYNKLGDLIPPDIQDRFADGAFDHPR